MACDLETQFGNGLWALMLGLFFGAAGYLLFGGPQRRSGYGDDTPRSALRRRSF